MRLEQLKYLLDIVQTHSITATAQRFFVTQQAVSSSLKQLENEMGAILLERKSSGVTLTKQGEMAVAFAQRTLNDFEQTCDAISVIKENENQQNKQCIRVCSASALNNILMPKVLSVLAKDEKGTSVNIIIANPEEMFAELADGRCDIGLLSLNTDIVKRLLAEYDSAGLCCKILMTDQLVACTSAQSSYAQQERITVEQINTMDKTLYGIIPAEKYRKDAFEGSILCSNDIEFHKRVLLQNDIYTLMPQVIYQKLFKGKKLTALPLELKNRVEITHGLIYRLEAEEEVLTFLNLMMECIRQL